VTLRLYDSATAAVADFVPLVPGRASIYVCGLTVQSEPHVGHIRFAVAFDVLRRWLTRSGYDVTYVRNVTDIDDKILARAAELGQPWWAHAYAMERAATAAYDGLGCLPPTYEPRATGHMPEMVELVAALLSRGHAYVAADGSGDVYFDVGSWPDYGVLSHQRVADMAPAEDADPRGKRDLHDFALWKGAKPTEPATASWAAPWGRGRPGWHLECTAMATRYLGPEFDIHGGGIDLRFPHHENEIAQARAAGMGFARRWMHNGWVTAAEEKMSKSLGNALLVREVIRRVRPVELRYYLASAHYRSTIEFSFEALSDAGASYRRVENFVRRASELTGSVGAAFAPVCADFQAAMDDDLGVPAALAALHDVVREGNKLLAGGDSPALRGNLASVRAMLDVLGVDPLASPWAEQAGSGAAGTDEALRVALDALVQATLAQREAARARRDFATADSLRDALAEAGILVEDTPTGTRWELR